MEKDSTVMFSRPVKLDFTSSCHYCMNIMDNEGQNIKDDDYVLVANDATQYTGAQIRVTGGAD